jgi:hypothetical protein
VLSVAKPNGPGLHRRVVLYAGRIRL